MTSPAPVWSIIQGFTSYWVVAAALDLGVFPAIADGRVADLDVSPRHLATLLDALCGLELLTRDGDQFALTPVAEEFLLPDSPAFMGDLVRWSPGLHDNWPPLAETIRTGRPPTSIDGSFYARLARATFPTQHAIASRTVGELGDEVSAVLDVGAGGAPWSVALLQAHPAATAVVNDLPEVLSAAEEAAKLHDVADRCRFLPGDYWAVDLDDEAFDVVVLGHVCRAEGAAGAPRLIERAADALRPGGQLVLTDYFVDDDRSGPLNALLLGVTMLANTDEGDTFTADQFQRWAADAGFSEIRVAEQQVMIAKKGDLR